MTACGGNLIGGERDEPPMTACGGNLIGGEISRNEQSLLWRVATIEAADRTGPRPVVTLGIWKMNGLIMLWRSCSEQ